MPEDSNLHDHHHETSSPTQQNSLHSVELGIQFTTHINSIPQTTGNSHKRIITASRVNEKNKAHVTGILDR